VKSFFHGAHRLGWAPVPVHVVEQSTLNRLPVPEKCNVWLILCQGFFVWLWQKKKVRILFFSQGVLLNQDQ
jgi:hypothetical protein